MTCALNVTLELERSSTGQFSKYSWPEVAIPNVFYLPQLLTDIVTELHQRTPHGELGKSLPDLIGGRGLPLSHLAGC